MHVSLFRSSEKRYASFTKSDIRHNLHVATSFIRTLSRLHPVQDLSCTDAFSYHPVQDLSCTDAFSYIRFADFVICQNGDSMISVEIQLADFMYLPLTDNHGSAMKNERKLGGEFFTLSELTN